jgi:hypothetical protein
LNDLEEGVVTELVSIIVPVHERPQLVREAVESAVAQTYRPIEIIVVDDGSSDETPAVCESMRRAHPELIRTIQRPNGGSGAARESGRRVARGEFIQYLDSDDRLYPRKLERLVEVLRSRPECDIAYCAGREAWLDEPRPRRRSSRCSTPVDTIFPTLLEGRIWPTLAPLYRREIVERIGPWTDLRQEEDLEYDARAGALGARLAWCDDELWEVRHHSGIRAGGGSQTSAERMRSRVEAHTLIYGHARRAGIGPDEPAMRVFARQLFLLARQAGAASLSEQSRALFELARQASGGARARGADFTVYKAAAAALGWAAAGRAAIWMDSARGKLRRRSGEA